MCRGHHSFVSSLTQSIASTITGRSRLFANGAADEIANAGWHDGYRRLDIDSAPGDHDSGPCLGAGFGRFPTPPAIGRTKSLFPGLVYPKRTAQRRRERRPRPVYRPEGLRSGSVEYCRGSGEAISMRNHALNLPLQERRAARAMRQVGTGRIETSTLPIRKNLQNVCY